MDSLMTLAPASLPREKAWTAPHGALGRRASGSGAVAVPTDDETDEALVERVVAGDQRAFTEIVRRHAGRIKALALGFSGGAAEADDIVQETFWSLWRNARRWRADGPPLAAYLTRSAMNRGIDASRRRRVRNFFGLADATDVIDPDPGADVQLEAANELEAVARDIRELPERQRAAILLAADGERATGEIAEALGLSVGAVEQLLVRARRRLRSRLAARDAPRGDLK